MMRFAPNYVLGWITLGLLHKSCHGFDLTHFFAAKDCMSRREALAKSMLMVTAPLVAAPTKSFAQESLETPFSAYKVLPDASATLNPNLAQMTKPALLKRLADLDGKNGGALWLGEHHNAVKDHNLQKEIIEAIHSASPKTPLAVGLEQVQVQFQPVLDDYIAGKLSLAGLKKKVEWERRWFWSFDGYAPIFEAARKRKIPLLALNVDSEDLAQVEKGGLAGLPPTRMKQYIKDPYGFAEFAKQTDFQEYVNYVIAPSYDLHERMGLLQTTIAGQKLEEPMTFRNFLSGRILWDESMASVAHSWVQSNPGGLLVGLVGADHVKFRDGIPARFSRMGGDALSCVSVILNPTLIDTRHSGSVSSIANEAASRNPEYITLQLRYLKQGVNPQDVEQRRLPESTGGVLPLSDYIILS